MRLLEKRIACFLVENLVIANVGPVQIVQQINESAQWHMAPVDFPKQTLLVASIILESIYLVFENVDQL